MYINSHSIRFGAASLLLWPWQASAASCPLLEAYYPAPTELGSSCKVQSAITKTQSDLLAALTNGSTYGKLDNELTAFSVDVYSLHNETSLYTQHFLPDELASQRVAGSATLDSDTVFRVGSVSKLLTAYLYMIKAGDSTLNRPVTDFVPELAAISQANKGKDSIDYVSWDTITLGALASHLAGLGRDSAYSPALSTELEQLGLVNQGGNAHSTCGDSSMALIPCNRTAFFEDFTTQHPVTGTFHTPAYSNAGYQIFSYAIENITGVPMSQLFQEALVEPLRLNGTFYNVPETEDSSIIPFNTTYSWWKADLLDEIPAGGYFSTTNDLRAIGKSILNSTLLNKSQTRRWMKPVTFTSNPDWAVGAPWEIVRAPGSPVSWMYGKSGDLGLYSGMVLLIPELEVGINLLAAGENASNQVRIAADIIAANFVPAFWDAAARETEATYAGTYADESTNSSITVATAADGPGLVASSWTLGGTDVIGMLAESLGATPSVRLYPMGLSAAGANGTTTTSWRAIFDTEQPNAGLISSSCDTWLLVNQVTFGGVGLDEFLFTLDSTGKTAESLESRFTLTPLAKAGAMDRRR